MTQAAAVNGGRYEWVRQAFLLEYLTVVWMVIEAAIAIGSAVATHSIHFDGLRY